MNYVFSAEHYNWLLEQEGVIKVTMIDDMTMVDFDTVANANGAFNDLANYKMNHYSMCETRILINPDV